MIRTKTPPRQWEAQLAAKAASLGRTVASARRRARQPEHLRSPAGWQDAHFLWPLFTAGQ